ncbi:MAG: site-2 protease family protein [Kofleriaceae bacterium]|nr:site-2 protease family protein [Kofleriaceae bacterium]
MVRWLHFLGAMEQREGLRWSWKLGSLAHIPVRVHVTMLILVGWIGVSYAVRGASLTAALTGIALIACVFAIIVVHELAHALVARRFGVETQDIVLLPIGGMSRMEELPERPREELLVSLAGPAVNVVLAGILALIVWGTGGAFRPSEALSLRGAFTAQLLWINVGLAVFNLLPAFPMDGGRALRALLTLKLGRPRATRVAAAIGKMLAALFVLLGITGNWLLVLIGVFVWMAATQEAAQVTLRSTLEGIPVARAMIRQIETLDAEQPIAEATDQMIASGHKQLPVVDHGRVTGIVRARDLVAMRGLPHAEVASAMRMGIPRVEATDTLDHAIDILKRARDDVALVVEHDAVVGILTLEQVAEYAAIHAR